MNLAQHPYALVIATWIFNTIITAFVGAFPAPTKSSSVFYQWWFVFSNSVIGNIKRAQATHVENSPNYEDAVKIRINGYKDAQDLKNVQLKPPAPPV